MRPRGFRSIPVPLLVMLMTFAMARAAAFSDSAASAAYFDRIMARVDSLRDAASYLQADTLAREGARLAMTAAAVDSTLLSSWLRKSAELSLELGRFGEADSLFRRSLGIEIRSRSDSTAAVLEALRGLATAALERENFDEAERGSLLCLGLGARIGAPDAAEAPEDLTRLAAVRTTQQRFAEAESLLHRAEALAATRRGRDREDLVQALSLQAELSYSKAKYQEAFSLFKRSIAVAEEIHGVGSDQAAFDLNGLAKVHRRLGDLEAAKECYERCLHTRERVYGPENPGVGTVLHDLGVLLFDMGDYEGAVRTAERALVIRSAAFGENDSRVALTMVTLARYLQGVGRYADAIKLARRAAELMKEARGSKHPQTALALSRLAGLLLRRGNAAEAEQLYRRSLKITEAVYGEEHPEVASHCMNLGLCLLDEARFDEAGAAFERSVRIGRAVYGAGSARTAVFERELARALAMQGKAGEGIAVLDTCLARQESQLGVENPNLIPTLTRLADVELASSRIPQAREHWNRAFLLSERVYGADHMYMVGPLLTGLDLDVVEGEWPGAVGKGIRATEIALSVQEEAYRGSSDEEAVQVLGLAARAVTALCGLIPLRQSCPDTTLQKVFCLLARTHGQVLDRMGERRQLIESAGSPIAGPIQREYVAACQRLANLVGKERQSSETCSPEVLRKARKDKDEAERALSEVSEEFRRRLDIKRKELAIAPANLAEILTPGSCLVHFVRYPDLTSGASLLENRLVSPIVPLPSGARERYGAYCLAKSLQGSWSLRFKDLGEAEGVDTLVAAYRRSIEGTGGTGRPTAREEAMFRRASGGLYRVVWEPLVPCLAAARGEAGESEPSLVFLVLDSNLLLVDFNTLLSPDQVPVIERWRIHHLSSARDLLKYAGEGRATRGRGLLVLGCSGRGPAVEHQGMKPENAAVRRQSPCEVDLESLPPLPGAIAEAERISGLFVEAVGEPVTLLVGPQATEESLKRLMRGRRITHLAAHGFFCRPERGGGRGDAGTGLTDPLLLSGLVLLPGSKEDDGVLFAQEIVGRDLRGTDWVVLSACATGLGEQLYGEGLSGLRRAFEIAGVRTVLSSMWQVRDDVARILMERLYSHRFAGESTVDAVRMAELERLQEVRSRFHRVHPVLWGGFVAEGDWR